MRRSLRGRSPTAAVNLRLLVLRTFSDDGDSAKWWASALVLWPTKHLQSLGSLECLRAAILHAGRTALRTGIIQLRRLPLLVIPDLMSQPWVAYCCISRALVSSHRSKVSNAKWIACLGQRRRCRWQRRRPRGGGRTGRGRPTRAGRPARRPRPPAPTPCWRRGCSPAWTANGRHTLAWVHGWWHRARGLWSWSMRK